MTVVFPDGILTAGRERVQFFPACANMNAPTVLELSAGVDISCYLIKGEFSPTAEQETAEDERVCSEQAGVTLGRVTQAIENMQYVYDPQAAAAAPDNLAYEEMATGVKGFIADRRGMASGDAFAAGQKVDVYQVECGVQTRVPISTDAGDKFKVQQTLGVSPNVVYDAVVAA